MVLQHEKFRLDRYKEDLLMGKTVTTLKWVAEETNRISSEDLYN